MDVIRRAFESAGVEFTDENGGGVGVRLRKRIDPSPLNDTTGVDDLIH